MSQTPSPGPLETGPVVAQPGTHASREPSVLADFDTGYVLDALSFAIIVLDQHLCAIYANAIAQDLLALQLTSIRGRPLVHFLPQPRRFTCAVRRAVRTGVPIDYALRAGLERWPENSDAVNVRICPLRSQISGAYVLVEMSAQTLVPSYRSIAQ